mmetsp:Transcript_114880/g.263795  ORF Transcript_114880/g.263795 Transcript_114880/m.263795 type:complete len:404 (+) Transcript_114880:354-1565(+)
MVLKKLAAVLVTALLTLSTDARVSKHSLLTITRGGSTAAPSGPHHHHHHGASQTAHPPNLAEKLAGGSSVQAPPAAVLQTTQFVQQHQHPVVSATESKPQVTTGGLEKGSHAYKVAIIKTVVAVAAAMLFGVGVWVVKGRQSSLEYYAGYFVEQSLSVDNLFVFIMLFDYFQVPLAHQARVLTWGIVGALAMRAVMIVVGVAAIQRFRTVTLVFAAILFYSGFAMLMESEEDEDLENNAIMKISKKLFKSTPKHDGDKFFTVIDGVKYATPMLMCLICIELSDLIFAVDSIPAVIGVSKDPFIVYTSNLFALAALRQKYVLVAKAVDDLPYLKPAVAMVLTFVGAKMMAEYFHYEIGIGVSLSVVGILLVAGIGASLIWPKEHGAKEEEVQQQKQQEQLAYEV